jgi:hypothetical protein
MLLASGPFSVLDWTEGTIVQSDSFAWLSPITRHPEEPPFGSVLDWTEGLIVQSDSFAWLSPITRHPEEPPFGSAVGLRCLRPDFLRLRRRLRLRPPEWNC